MNLPMLIVAALLALPAGGYLTYQTLQPDADALVAASSADETPSESAAREDERYAGTQTIGLSAGAPYPTCPTSCTFGYSFFNEGALEFDVPEGAKAIEVRATWDSAVPTTLSVGLYHPDEECGDRCWMGDASGKGTGSVTFVFEDPAASAYRVSAHGVGPAYVVAKQDVSLEVVVRYS